MDMVNDNPFSADPDALESIGALIDALRREGDSIGAEVTVMAMGSRTGRASIWPARCRFSRGVDGY